MFFFPSFVKDEEYFIFPINKKKQDLLIHVNVIFLAYINGYNIYFNVVLRQYKDMIHHRFVTATRDINLILMLETTLKYKIHLCMV